jgi:hypothetical protein
LGQTFECDEEDAANVFAADPEIRLWDIQLEQPQPRQRVEPTDYATARRPHSETEFRASLKTVVLVYDINGAVVEERSGDAVRNDDDDAEEVLEVTTQPQDVFPRPWTDEAVTNMFDLHLQYNSSHYSQIVHFSLLSNIALPNNGFVARFRFSWTPKREKGTHGARRWIRAVQNVYLPNVIQ